MKKFLIAIFSVVVLSSLAIAPVGAYDIVDPCDKGYATDCPEKESATVLENRVGDVVQYALMGVGAIAVIFIIIGGITFATSAGDPEKVKKAKSTVLFSLIGLGLAVLANVIVDVVITASQDVIK
jgi:hypothetical protein